jgi:nucleoside-diphosphate-sugar epimerase
MSKILERKYPALPNIYMQIVDVRDVAEAHLRAITMSNTKGRYILAEGKIQNIKT